MEQLVTFRRKVYFLVCVGLDKEKRSMVGGNWYLVYLLMKYAA